MNDTQEVRAVSATTPTPKPVSPSETRVWDGAEAIPAAIIAAFIVGLPLRLLLPAETRFMLVSISLSVVASTIVFVMPGMIVQPAMWLMKGLAGLVSSVASPAPALRMEIHTHGGHGTKTAAKHEGGHAAVTRAIGGKVHSVQIFPDGSGVTRVTFPRNATPAQVAAVCVAGEVAAGTSAGCGGDQANLREVLRELPSSERGAVKRAGYSMARSVCNGWFSDGGVSSTASELLKKGTVRY